MTHRAAISLFVLAASLALLVACGGGGSANVSGPSFGDGSTMEVVLTDHPIQDDVESVMVTIDSVTAHHRNGTVYEMLDRPVTVDLLELRGRHRSLGVRDVPPGTYDRLGLHVTDGHLMVDGTRRPMQFAANDGEMLGPFEAPRSGVAVVVIDFDAEASIDVHHGAPHSYHMDPVLRRGGYETRDVDDCPDHQDHHPGHGSVDVPVSSEIRVSYPMAGMQHMRPADPSGIIEVRRPDGPAVQGATEVADGVVTFRPHDPLEHGAVYEVELHRGRMPGFHFCAEDVFSFTTR